MARHSAPDSGSLLLNLAPVCGSWLVGMLETRKTSFFSFSFLQFSYYLQEFGLLYLPRSATCTTSFFGFTLLLDGFCFWGGVGYFPEFSKLLTPSHAYFVRTRLRGVGMGGCITFGDGTLLGVFGAV